MDEMRKYAYEYEVKHKKTGMVSKLEDYRFLFTTYPDKNGKTNQTVFYKSYFLN